MRTKKYKPCWDALCHQLVRKILNTVGPHFHVSRLSEAFAPCQELASARHSDVASCTAGQNILPARKTAKLPVRNSEAAWTTRICVHNAPSRHLDSHSLRVPKAFNARLQPSSCSHCPPMTAYASVESGHLPSMSPSLYGAKSVHGGGA